MALPDITTLTLEELQQLAIAAAQAIAARQEVERTEDEARRAAIGDAITALSALLGPEDAPPGTGSIRAVRAFDAADIAAGKPRGTTMAENSGLALSLLYEGMDALTATVLNISRVLATD